MSSDTVVGDVKNSGGQRLVASLILAAKPATMSIASVPHSRVAIIGGAKDGDPPSAELRARIHIHRQVLVREQGLQREFGLGGIISFLTSKFSWGKEAGALKRTITLKEELASVQKGSCAGMQQMELAISG